MGVSAKLRDLRPPLPAPTESMDEEANSGPDTELATNITARTDKTSYEIPEDGSPLIIPTARITSKKEGGSAEHQRGKSSQTSLLIEYFEGSRTGDKTKSRPSVRVKVTPSSRRKSGGGGHDAVQITGIGKDRKPSYTRRISLGSSGKDTDVALVPGGTAVSHSSGSTLSGRPPVEIEVLDHNGSDLSTRSRGLMYAVNESNVSSLPPDSMLEGSNVNESEVSRDVGAQDNTIDDAELLKAPQRQPSARTASRERIAQRVMEKLSEPSPHSRQYNKSRSARSLGREYEGRKYSPESLDRSLKSRGLDEDAVGGSVLSSGVAPSQRSYRSGSDISNNPKLLGMVEDTIKRIILPEINAIKQDQKTDRNLRSLEDSRRGSLQGDGPAKDGLFRRVSKSTSSPSISTKPKVVLNKDGDDPGTVLSRGDSERKQRKSSRSRQSDERPSSRRSSGRSSRMEDDETIRATSRKSSRGLTTAALSHHNSEENSPARRKRRNKSGGSLGQSDDPGASGGTYLSRERYLGEETIPPMPMASNINDSDITRESIISADTERPSSRHSGESRTPIREVSRGSLSASMSPAQSGSRTPNTRSPGMANDSTSFGSTQGLSPQGRMAALAAAASAAYEGSYSSRGGTNVTSMLQESYNHHLDADGYGGSPSQRNVASPVQSVSSSRKNLERYSDQSRELRPHSAASRSSAGRSFDKRGSQTSLQSGVFPQALNSSRSRDVSASEREQSLERPNPAFAREATGSPRTPGTPTHGESVDDWYERQHRLNDEYRNSLESDGAYRDSFAATNRDSYQTNPFPQDENRWTMFSTGSEGEQPMESSGEQNVRSLGANPNFTHTPHAAQSAVASLMGQSTVSSGATTSGASFNDRMTAHLREMGKDSPSVYQGSTLSQTMPSQDRWTALRTYARDMSASTTRDDVDRLESPRQSPAKSLGQDRSADRDVPMTANSMPMADDPLPEIGHFDDSKSQSSSKSSIVREPLGGDATGQSTWPYTPEPYPPPKRELASGGARSAGSASREHDDMMAATVAGASDNSAAYESQKSPGTHVDNEDRGLTPSNNDGERIDGEASPTSPAAFRDEGYDTSRSAGALTPRALQPQQLSKDIDDYDRAMAAQDLGEDDPFTSNEKRARYISGYSAGMSSPLYDSATGKGVERIQSKDIVALMDHLTVRDSQRNARDTEILISLVRSAAEMRQSFDEMKQFIVEQDRMIMSNANRAADHTAQRVLSGPRPQPQSSPRVASRRESEEEIQNKRKGVLRRALKGLSGGKSSNNLGKVEDMLMQILDNVEDLKHQGVQQPREPLRSYTDDSLNTYEKPRSAPDAGYEPEGQAGTSSTPSHSGGNLSLTPRADKQQFHSGYDGRRGSNNRVSTVLEGDEDDLEPHEAQLLEHQFEDDERMRTPTQEYIRQRGLSPHAVPPQQSHRYSTGQGDELTPRSAEQQRKHKSNSSSVFGLPKISRWSKTTASSGPPDPASPSSPQVATRGLRPASEASQSTSTFDKYDEDQYEDENRPRSQDVGETKSVRSQASKLTRTPSPLIPSERSISQHNDYENDRGVSPVQEDVYDPQFDDPKYQAQRNSIPLQHPQPRPGPTGRHQNTLETQAHDFDGGDRTNSDLSQRSVSDFDPATWGSSGTAGLAKYRLSQQEPVSPVSMATSKAYGGSRAGRDEGPLVPQQSSSVPRTMYNYEDEQEISPNRDWEPSYSNSGFGRAPQYSSPWGSGHLLEPIQEVRYSLETDSGHVSSPLSRLVLLEHC